MLVGLLAVGRAVATGAEQGLDQSFLAWLWALVGGDAGKLLTQLEDEADADDAYMICMTEVRWKCPAPVALRLAAADGARTIVKEHCSGPKSMAQGL